MAGQGKVSPAVYRRRRLVVGVAALTVLALVIWVVSAMIGAIRGPATRPTVGGNAAVPSTSSGPGACDPAKVSVAASTDAPSYSSGQNPVFSLIVSNIGDTVCKINLGTSQMEFVVTSGEDRVFSSKDCQQDPQDLLRTMAPGASEKANFLWKRNRTVPGCTPVKANLGTGPEATYTLTTKLGKLSSQKQPFVLVS